MTIETKTKCPQGKHRGPFTEFWKVESVVREIEPEHFDQATGKIDQVVYAGSQMIWDNVSDNTLTCEACMHQWKVCQSVAEVAHQHDADWFGTTRILDHDGLNTDVLAFKCRNGDCDMQGYYKINVALDDTMLEWM